MSPWGSRRRFAAGRGWPGVDSPRRQQNAGIRPGVPQRDRRAVQSAWHSTGRRAGPAAHLPPAMSLVERLGVGFSWLTHRCRPVLSGRAVTACADSASKREPMPVRLRPATTCRLSSTRPRWGRRRDGVREAHQLVAVLGEDGVPQRVTVSQAIGPYLEPIGGEVTVEVVVRVEAAIVAAPAIGVKGRHGRSVGWASEPKLRLRASHDASSSVLAWAPRRSRMPDRRRARSLRSLWMSPQATISGPDPMPSCVSRRPDHWRTQWPHAKSSGSHTAILQRDPSA